MRVLQGLRSTAARRAARLQRAAGQPVDALPLVVFRIGFGLLMLVGVVRFAAKGWIRELYVDPVFLFSALGLTWLRPPSEPWLSMLFVWIGACSLAIALGWRTRWAALGFVVVFTWIELFDTALYLNHYYFVSWLGVLMIALPLGRSLSLDAGPVTVPVARGWLWALRMQVGLVYFFAGIAKLQGDWLLRAEPMATWLPARAHLPVLGPVLEQGWVAFAASWAAAAFDLSVPFLLCFRRTRRGAYLAVMVFHSATALLFEIGMFPWIMVVCAAVFFPGTELRKVVPTRWLGDSCEVPEAGTARARHDQRRRRPVFVAAAFVFFGIQLLLPWRHLLYPGDVLWTEEGFRYSWRVMVVEKTGHVEFRVQRADGETERVHPSQWLTMQQEGQMSVQPSMIRDFAVFLAGLEGEGTRVYADAWVSLNGRTAQRLIDPHVDLAGQPRGWWAKRWVLPGPGERSRETEWSAWERGRPLPPAALPTVESSTRPQRRVVGSSR